MTNGPTSSSTNSRKVFATISPGPKKPLRPEIADWLLAVQQSLGVRLILCVQDGQSELGLITDPLYRALLQTVRKLPPGEPAALLLHSGGGYADSAYRIAKLLRAHCGEFLAVVPSIAKSAATLLTLGADRIILAPHAELGPLDAQVFDIEVEQRMSALEVVQSLERLNSEAMQAVDAIMRQWVRASGKRTDQLLPVATQFVSDLLRPVFEKVDTLKYTQMARSLRIAEDYATRLLDRKYGDERSDGMTRAEVIASALTKGYSDHGFVLDIEELQALGLDVETPEPGIDGILIALGMAFGDDTIIGLIEDEDDDAHQQPKEPDVNRSNQDGAPRRRRRASNPSGKDGAADAVVKPQAP